MARAVDRKPWRELPRIVAGLALTLALPAGLAPTLAVADETLLGAAGAWEARTAEVPEQGRRCLLWAIDPVIADGDVFWIFDPAHGEHLPDGFLVVDRRLAMGAAAVTLSVDQDSAVALQLADDLHFYSPTAESGALYRELRRGLLAEITFVGDSATADRTIRLSLVGFTRTSDMARAACGL